MYFLGAAVILVQTKTLHLHWHSSLSAFTYNLIHFHLKHTCVCRHALFPHYMHPTSQFSVFDQRSVVSSTAFNEHSRCQLIAATKRSEFIHYQRELGFPMIRVTAMHQLRKLYIYLHTFHFKIMDLHANENKQAKLIKEII